MVEEPGSVLDRLPGVATHLEIDESRTGHTLLSQEISLRAGTQCLADQDTWMGPLHTEHFEPIKGLKRAQRRSEALALLLKCVEATEAEDSLNGWGVAPGYYEELAILYRKEKRYADEVAILERFTANSNRSVR